MKQKFQILCVTAFLAVMGSMSTAYAKCYEEVLIPAELNCADKAFSKSADFNAQCELEKGRTQQVEVDCPMSWYPVNEANNELTQAQFCDILGLKPGSFSGQICASGENIPPSSQEGNHTIKYWAKRTGGTGIGVKSEIITRTFTKSCRDCDRTTTIISNRYCWHNGQKKDLDGSDILVAWVCQ